MHCDNQSAIYITQNHVFHKSSKHIKSEMLGPKGGFSLTPPSKQLADLLTKTASPQVFSNLCSKMGIIDIYTPA